MTAPARSRCACGSKSRRHSTYYVFALAIMLCGVKVAIDNSHELSNQFWIALNKYSSLVDGHLEKCYNQVPTAPGFWDVQREGKLNAAASCPLGPVPDYGIEGGSKRSAVLRTLGSDAPSMSAECGIRQRIGQQRQKSSQHVWRTD